MNPGIDYYRPYGQPAVGSITVIAKPAATPNVVVAGVTYTFGTHFWGDRPAAIAESLTAAINSSRGSYGYSHRMATPIRDVFAVFFGPVVTVIATMPGLAGNVLGLTTTDATSFTLSGATLAGGTINTGSLGTVTTSMQLAASGTARTLYGGARTMTGVAIPLSVSSSLYTKLHLFPATANVATIYLGNSAAQHFPLVAGTWTTFDPPPGCFADRADIYVIGTLGDVLNTLYWD